jgi:hypothetical protein
MADSPLKIGLIVGREWSFPPAFIEEVNSRDAGVVAEYVKVGAPRMDEAVPYAVILDRISHEVPFYRSYLKHAVLEGTVVVNNPFLWSAGDRYFGASLARRLGVPTPKTVVLPHKEYAPGIVHDESLRNLVYPLDWQGVLDHVGLPCALRDAREGSGGDLAVCHSLEELLRHYNQSGRRTVIVQELIEWEQFVRCICVGQQEVLVMSYDPGERRYLPEREHIAPALEARVVENTRTLMRGLGYDMCSLEFAIRDGVPYAVDFMNAVPDVDINSLTAPHFEWVVRRMADLAIRLAREPRPQPAESAWSRVVPSASLTGRSDRDGAGDLAEELPSLARDMTGRPPPVAGRPSR